MRGSFLGYDGVRVQSEGEIWVSRLREESPDVRGKKDFQLVEASLLREKWVRAKERKKEGDPYQWDLGPI